MSAKSILHVMSRPASPEVADEYNRWYEDVHMPEVVALEGFVSARRYAPTQDGGPYIAVYEIEGDAGEAMKRLNQAMSDGSMNLSDKVQLDPPPQMGVFALTKEVGE
ncbi:DUF4286 family protein [Actinomadura sp. WMMB 499]|uniref:DUF4286 family protein n=1 Tax=Actinomadura sp. WMMB 499 TaxID=1219491 RepID=UPI00124783A7|nr:DUF4286 family protein [Actinomadura sp. WMMB 499]QFG20733.1 hypothetical protein F7P10_05795 [Actinomadura sp. WMMB 499]